MKSLRNGSWLTLERLRLYPAALLIASIIGVPIIVGLFPHARLGIDFSATWAADHILVSGGNFYDAHALSQVERSATGASDFFPFPYPPSYAVVTAPLGFLPYKVALLVWSIAGLGAFLTGIRMLTRGSGTLQALAFPGVLVNLLNGQNGLFIASLMAAALAQLTTREWLAGVFFGLISIKPHLGIMLPLALAAARAWRAFFAAAITATALMLISLVILGVAPWHEFLLIADIYRSDILDGGNSILTKMVTVFASASHMGLSLPLAYLLQGMTFVIAGVTVIFAWRAPRATAVRYAVLSLATAVAFPYLFDYDLAIIAPAIAAMAILGIEEGFMPWEKTMLALLWTVPAVARPLAILTALPMVPGLLLLALGLFFRHTSATSANSLLHPE